MNTKSEEEFNTALGRRLTAIRGSHKMSQEHLGAMLGVKYQQIHKYETGENRMSPERIQACAEIFKVPVGYFYGEGESGSNYKRYDKTVMLVAAEIMDLPEDIRKGVYILSRQINKTFSGDNKKEKQEQAA